MKLNKRHGERKWKDKINEEQKEESWEKPDVWRTEVTMWTEHGLVPHMHERRNVGDNTGRDERKRTEENMTPERNRPYALK